MDAIEACKQLQRTNEDRHLRASKRAEEKITNLLGDLTGEHLKRWRAEQQSPPHPTALLTGFPRSGTTLLEQLLDAHSGIVSSEERDFLGKELMWRVTAKQGTKSMVDVIDSLRPAQIDEQRGRYFESMEYLLGEPIGDRVHLDKNPAYNPTLPLMLRVLPETRVVVALRDPRDVVLSCYLRYLPLNAISVRFLTPERTAERYALDMRAWLRLRSMIETPWCEVRYEDTVADPAAQASRVFDTLGLAWEDDVLRYRERLGRERQVTSPTYEAVAEPIYTRSIERWRHYERLLEPALPVLEPFIAEFSYS